MSSVCSICGDVVNDNHVDYSYMSFLFEEVYNQPDSEKNECIDPICVECAGKKLKYPI